VNNSHRWKKDPVDPNNIQVIFLTTCLPIFEVNHLTFEPKALS